MARRRRSSSDAPKPAASAEADPAQALMQGLGNVAAASAADTAEMRRQLREHAQRITQAIQQAEETGEDVVATLERNVREQPLVMLVGAVGVGILLGRWIRGD
jgi:ElaB/YqjD/DUF883 family membrane-anchored ribosome-binding protein